MILDHSCPSRKAGADAQKTKEEDNAKANLCPSVDTKSCQKWNWHNVNDNVTNSGDDGRRQRDHVLGLAKALFVGSWADGKLLEEGDQEASERVDSRNDENRPCDPLEGLTAKDAHVEAEYRSLHKEDTQVLHHQHGCAGP